jgi:flagellar basal-body rod modification protein FlgD
MQIVTNSGAPLIDPTVQGSQRVDAAALDQQDFLTLMVEQLRNQNPLEPQDGSEYFAQLVQFDTLETMRTMSEAIESLVAVSELANASVLVGRAVRAEIPRDPDPETGFPRDAEVVEGVVERVTLGPSGTLAFVDGRPLPFRDIVEVSGMPEPELDAVEQAAAAPPTSTSLDDLAVLLSTLAGANAAPAAAPAAPAEAPSTGESTDAEPPATTEPAATAEEEPAA